MPMSGIPFSPAMRKRRASLLPLVASIEPARTVKSWP